VAVNLAVRLAELGRRVTLIDCDAGTANADLLLDVEPRRTLADYLAGRCTAAQAALRVAGGARFIAGSSGDAGPIERAAPRDWSRVITDLAPGDDLAILDCGAGVGPEVRGPAVCADLLLVVTTPEPTAVTDAYALIKIVRPAAARVLLLVNQADGARQADDVTARIVAAAERFLKVRIEAAGFIHADRHVRAAMMRRAPCSRLYPRCRASKDLSLLADRLHHFEGSLSLEG
jgi:flagellar biosynthesis protein FlhG